MTTTRYTLTCLSPVHVGTGNQLGKFDGAYQDRQWFVIDLDAVLAHPGVDANALARAMSERNFSWDVWLQKHGLAAAGVAAYALPCPQDPGTVAVRDAIKTYLRQPYLPGTSVKGALRAAVLTQLIAHEASHQAFAAQYLQLCLCAQDLHRIWQERQAFDNPDIQRETLAQLLDVSVVEARGYQQTLYHVLNVRETQLREQRVWRNLQRQLSRLGRSREWLGQPIERAVLGRDPNHDLMRAVQVGDSQPVAIEHLAVGLVWTYTLRGGRLAEKRESHGDYKSFAEWLPPDTSLRLDIRLDEYLFGDAAGKELRFGTAREQAVRQLARTCNAHAQALAAAEKAFFSTYGPTVLHEFYQELEATLSALPDGAFLLNVGWGGGWEVKTLGDLLRTALGREAFREVRQRYRLGRNPDAPFPKTRRLAYEGGAAQWPMGWVKLTPNS